MADYRIEFAIQRREHDAEDFTEIGFGSSGEWSTLDACTHMIDSAVSRGEWEREACQPNPVDVLAAIAQGRNAAKGGDA